MQMKSDILVLLRQLESINVGSDSDFLNSLREGEALLQIKIT